MKTFLVFSGVLLTLFVGSWLTSNDAEKRYQALLSPVLYDRYSVPLSIQANSKGHYVYETKQIPPDLEALLLRKEDNYFRYHFGINPFSVLRAGVSYLLRGDAGGSSTLTQQLAKNLLGTETNRTIANKIRETWYALSLELMHSKSDILLMYANTVYLGNQVQGLETGSRAYFDKPLADLTPAEQLSLLATLSYPSGQNPWEADNESVAEALATRLQLSTEYIQPKVTDQYSFQDPAHFELQSSGIACKHTCHTTIDASLTAGLRAILDQHIEKGWNRNVRNGAIVVLDANTSELLAIVGSRDPSSTANGNQINMAIAPRPIGSTVKPFIYAKGFERGLRPYTIVEDREYKYPIATGYYLYPKNYDGQYRGEVTLHEALSNSLNVPSVKVLEYIGLQNFYRFLSDDLQFVPIQDYEQYQFGIALGGLEMDLLTLTHYFTTFPQGGSIQPLRVLQDSAENFSLPIQSNINSQKEILDKASIELVQKIISDRFTGVNQFGLESNLNLTITDYAVKTGTSRDFHDSWVVGYTPDVVVGVWLGNVENEALAQVSGQTGAGAVWHDVMEYIINSDYNQSTAFTYNHVVPVTIDKSQEWGLTDDDVAQYKVALQEGNLIMSVHADDIFELTDDTVIPLEARREVAWFINGVTYGTAVNTTFKPTRTGVFEIMAVDKTTDTREIITIELVTP